MVTYRFIKTKIDEIDVLPEMNFGLHITWSGERMEDVDPAIHPDNFVQSSKISWVSVDKIHSMCLVINGKELDITDSLVDVEKRYAVERIVERWCDDKSDDEINSFSI